MKGRVISYRSCRARGVPALVLLVILSTCSGENLWAGAGTGTLFGTEGDTGSFLFTVNTTTGVGTFVGSSTVGDPFPALAVDPTTGIMYAARDSVYVVNPTTGATTLVGNIGLGTAARITGMDFTTGGTLYASVNIAGGSGSSQPGGGDHLAIINKATGAATVIGPFGACTGVVIPTTGGGSCTIEGIEAIAFDFSGVLWGARRARGSSSGDPPGLYSINPTTGAATFLRPILDSLGNPPSGGVVSLQFRCDGVLFGGTANEISPATDGGRLITINPATGLFSFVGSVAAVGRSLAALAFQSPCAPIVVDGKANIFGAGHTTPPAPAGGGGGTLPPFVTFSSGPGKVLRFSSVTGSVSCDNSIFVGPDGGNCRISTDVTSFGGISGLIHNSKNLFLVGVFLDDSEPADPAPVRLDFSTNTNYSTLAPLLRQTFFIGDGLTGTGSGSVQQILVPSNATRLFLGFVDAWNGSNIAGPPGFYDDNGGSVTAQFTVSTSSITTPPVGSSLCGLGNPAPISGSTGAQGVLDPANTVPPNQPDGGLIWPANAAGALIDMDTGQVEFVSSGGGTVGSGILPGVGSPIAFPDGKLNFTSVHLPVGKAVGFRRGSFGLRPPVILLSCQDVIVDGIGGIAFQENGVLFAIAFSFPGGNGSFQTGFSPAGFGPRSGSLPAAGSLYPPVGGGGGNGGASSDGVSQGPDGGLGGSAFVIAAAQRITINGLIGAMGVPAETGSTVAQGGAGGSVRLAAVLVEGVGTISTAAGLDADQTTGAVPRSPAGPIEIQAFVQDLFSGTTTTPRTPGNPPVAAPIPDNLPKIRVTRVGPPPVAAIPNTGSLTTPDVPLAQSTTVVAVPIEVCTQRVPVGTLLVFRAVGVDGSAETATGTVGSTTSCAPGESIASASLTLKPGVTYQIVGTPSTAFALARNGNGPVPLAEPILAAGGTPGVVSEPRLSRAQSREPLASGVATDQTASGSSAEKWARAFGVDMGAQKKVARLTAVSSAVKSDK